MKKLKSKTNCLLPILTLNMQRPKYTNKLYTDYKFARKFACAPLTRKANPNIKTSNFIAERNMCIVCDLFAFLLNSLVSIILRRKVMYY